MMLFFKKIPNILYVSIFLYFIITCSSIYSMQGFVNSPDESANRFFATQWSEKFSLSAKIPIEQPSSYPLFPRSTVPAENNITPAGFVGAPIIFGSIQKIFGAHSIYFVTPIIVALSSVAWWFLMKKIFSENIAKISAVLYLFHPALLYYSVRGLFPNAPMIALSIVAIALAWFAYERSSRVALVLGIFAGALAALIRPLEVFVLLGLAAISACIWGDTNVKKKSAWAIGTMVFLASIIFILRTKVSVPGGYSFVSINSLSSVLFPFGFYPGRIFHACISYIVKLFSPWVLVSTTGLIWWLYDTYKTKKYKKEIAAYLTVVIPFSLWVFALYGSWSFTDNPQNPEAITLGSSYVRYWLPHVIFRMPFAVVLLYACIEKYKMRAQRVINIFIGAFVLLGLWRAFFGVEGLLWLRAESLSSLATKQEVLGYVPENAVIAVRAWDKVFFPDRLVIQPFPRDPRIFGALKELHSRNVPLFAFISTVTDADTLWLRDNKISLEKIEVFGVHTLYKFVWKNE